MEYKSIPMEVKTIEGRIVTGVFAVHGNVDDYGDISHPGSFTKTIAERGAKVKYMWNHDLWGGPPTAKVQSLREITRDELPPSVLQAAPDATGGVEVVREYLSTANADAVFEAVKAGAVDELSYGYDALKYDYMDINGRQVRNLREVKLWEVSDVIFGANPATAASKLLGLSPYDILLKQIEAHIAAVKAGARHSSADVKAINAIHRAVVDLGATECAGVKDLEAAADDEASKEEADDAAKSRAATQQALTLLKSKLDILELELAF